MSQIISSYYNAFNNNNRSEMMSFLSDDIIHEVNQGLAQIGLEKFEKFMDHMDECYQEKLEDIVVMYNSDSTRAAAEFTVVGTYLKTDGSLPPAHGQKYAIRAGAFFEITKTQNQQKISRITTYYNLPGWIELMKK